MLLYFCVAFFAIAVLLRVRYLPRQQRTMKQRFETAKLLVGALLAFGVIYYNLQHANIQLDGKAETEPSLFEKIVRYFGE